MSAERVSVVDVARVLGVAPSTVSRAFNHPERLRPETVTAVQDAAARLGYVPNRHARALITGRSGAIGLIVPDITNPFFPKLVRAAQRSAEAKALSMFVAETGHDPERERQQLATMAPQTEGIIVASSRLPPAELRLVSARTRTVFVNNDVPGTARVLLRTSDALAGGVEHLAGTGVRRLCYVGGPERSWSEGERRTAVLDRAAALGLAVSVLRAPAGTYSEGRMLADQVHAAGADGVVAFDDVVAHGVLDGLLQHGVRVPDDVSLLGCDDALPIQTHPRMSTVHLPLVTAMRAAMGLITARDDLSDTVVDVHGVLELRETTRPADGP